MDLPKRKNGPKLPPKPPGGGAAARRRQAEQERGLDDVCPDGNIGKIEPTAEHEDIDEHEN